jgi:outer membrane lipoprotein SlyB
MRKLLFAGMVLSGFASISPAHALGCLSGAAAGALAGHYAGHHAFLGAMGGCIAGHQWHKHQLNQQGLQNTQAYDEQRRAADPDYKSPWGQQQ